MPKINRLKVFIGVLSAVPRVYTLYTTMPQTWWINVVLYGAFLLGLGLIVSGFGLHATLRREWITLQWQSITNSFRNAADMTHEAAFHYLIINKSSVPLTVSRVTGRLRFNGQQLSNDVEIEDPVLVLPHGEAPLTILQRLTDKEAEHLQKFADQGGHWFDAGRVKCTVRTNRLFAVFANQIGVVLPNPGLRNS